MREATDFISCAERGEKRFSLVRRSHESMRANVTRRSSPPCDRIGKVRKKVFRRYAVEMHLPMAHVTMGGLLAAFWRSHMIFARAMPLRSSGVRTLQEHRSSSGA